MELATYVLAVKWAVWMHMATHVAIQVRRVTRTGAAAATWLLRKIKSQS